jgi:hypothetical protein
MRDRKIQVKPTDSLIYVINLDERGEFFADVRKVGSGETIYEIHGFDIFEDGFMKNKTDVSNLRKYLVQIGIIAETNQLELSS